MNECMVVSRGINHCTAFEAALKMSETSYISADPYSAADLMHGPIAVVHEDLPCFLYAADGKALGTLFDTLKKVKSKGAETVVFAHDDAFLEDADTRFKMPGDVDELVSPMVYIVAGQLFAHYLSKVKGHDPDRPRGLKKVTLTR
jgi:glucosamine--fructose-6-phosphate aminotransferase (isomerizing)